MRLGLRDTVGGALPLSFARSYHITGDFCLKNFELLIFSCREMIKRSIHTLYDVSKINSFIYRKRIFCVITVILALFIDSKTSKYLMRFLHYAFFFS